MLSMKTKACEIQTMGGVFPSRQDAERAIQAFLEMGVAQKSILVIQLNDNRNRDPYTSFLVGSGFTHSQALYYDKAIRLEKILVTLYEIDDPDSVVEIFDRYGAKYHLRSNSLAASGTR